MTVSAFNYQPREHIWAIINKLHEDNQATQQEVLTVLQEYIYCMEGRVYAIQQPKNEAETDLMFHALPKAFDAFMRHVQ